MIVFVEHSAEGKQRYTVTVSNIKVYMLTECDSPIKSDVTVALASGKHLFQLAIDTVCVRIAFAWELIAPIFGVT